MGPEVFTIVDNPEAVKVGDLVKTSESRPVVKPKFRTDFPEAEQMSYRCEEKKRVCCAPFIDTTAAGEKRWEPPLLNEDWHAFCQGVEVSEWETMYYRMQGDAPSGQM